MSTVRREELSAEIEVRHCHGLAEFEACLDVQKRVWSAADADVVPLPLFVVAAETGGQVLGAFAGPKMVGFTMAVAGVRDGQPFLHSHMTAVLGEFRDRGIGRQLKLFQRQDALGRGMQLVEWTFDPLEVKNAYFNLMRLGAIARRFLPNCYGITSSPLHAGLPTDRLVAEWWLSSSRVKAVLAGQEPSPGASAAVIEVPATVGELRQKDVQQAARVQGEIREQFQHWFARGYAATGMERAAEGAKYLLESCARR
jgi:predicted GNAT superfamily acetyltransferase